MLFLSCHFPSNAITI